VLENGHLFILAMHLSWKNKSRQEWSFHRSWPVEASVSQGMFLDPARGWRSDSCWLCLAQHSPEPTMQTVYVVTTTMYLMSNLNFLSLAMHPTAKAHVMSQFWRQQKPVSLATLRVAHCPAPTPNQLKPEEQSLLFVFRKPRGRLLNAISLPRNGRRIAPINGLHQPVEDSSPRF
jgi:hypothetical protein